MERIGEYLIKRMVGEGGMGRVYEAEERLSKRRVALKVLRQELLRDEDGRRLFQSEMQILAHLEHPNLVRSLASVEEDGQLVLVLEYLEGKTLREVLNDRGALPWQEAVEIVAQMAAALGVAHAQTPPIVHRDLKPENVMVCDDGVVKVMDFGIAKVLEQAHAPSTQSIGTLQYMSPEQIDARPIDARSDLYALGLVLYELLAGEPPFRSASPRELLNLQCTAEPSAMEDVEVPAGVEDLVFDLLAKDPAERPESAETVLDALAPLRAGRKTKKTRGASSGKPGRAEKTLPAEEADDAEPAPRAVAESRTGGTLDSSPPRKNDTVALVEKATAPRRISMRWGVGLIVAASLLSGLATYGVRTHYWGKSKTAASVNADDTPGGDDGTPRGDHGASRAR